MRSTLLVTLFTLYLATLSFAVINSMSAPATVKKGQSFKVTFHTGHSTDDDIDNSMVLSYMGIPCNSCFGTYAAAFDLGSQGHDFTDVGSFTETLKAPTVKGTYYITSSILYIVAGHYYHLGLRFLTYIEITVTD
ncbi:hypothetical protein FRB96_005388 [Tulasnella sp. 330]|nr:hypothetical protein FRB96_005388 [Tulasnella sp. 330]